LLLAACLTPAAASAQQAQPPAAPQSDQQKALSQWLDLPLGMKTHLGFLACPLSQKEKDWLTFGAFVENIYEKQENRSDNRAEIKWAAGKNDNEWIMTISEKNDEGRVVPNQLLFRRFTTQKGNTIVAIEQVLPQGKPAPDEKELADVWNDVCISHGGLGWKNVK
jgi:hypothetical protein